MSDLIDCSFFQPVVVLKKRHGVILPGKVFFKAQRPVVNLINILRSYITTLESQYGQICSQYDSRVVIYARKMFI